MAPIKKISYWLCTDRLLRKIIVCSAPIHCTQEHRIQFLGTFAKFRKATVSFVMHVCPSAWNNSPPTELIFLKLIFEYFSEKLSRKFKFHLNRTRITGTLHVDQYTCMIISPSFLLRMRNILDKIVERIRTHICYFQYNLFLKITLFMRQCGKIFQRRTAHCMLNTCV